MATNRVIADPQVLSVVCSNPTTPASGDPVRFGGLCGVALTDEAEGGNPTGYTSVDFGPAVYDLSVKGVDDDGNSAVAIGDHIFYVDADTPKLSKKTSGYYFGIALEAVISAATTTIKVLMGQAAGSGVFASNGVTTTKIIDDAVTNDKLANIARGSVKVGGAANAPTDLNAKSSGYILVGDGTDVASVAVSGDVTLSSAGAVVIGANKVTSAMLTATMAKGFIPLDITTLKLINTNAIINTTEGGLPDGNTAPSLARVNGATDKALRVIWAASASGEVQFPPVPKPPDLDGAAALTLHLMLGKDSNTDNAVVVTAGIYDGVGDTDAGGATAALAAATLAEYTVTLAHGDLAEHPGFLNICLTPGTHTTDAIWLYAAWLEYTRK